jgi:hypothetical protein
MPFAMMFVSNDKLHRRAAPLFLRDDQLFVVGEELKRDLTALDTYYSGRPEEEREQGLFRLAGYPPEDETYLTTRIWRHFKMRTRPAVEEADPEKTIPKPAAQKMLAMVKEMQIAAKSPSLGTFTRAELDDANHMVIERRVPLQRGKWRLMPRGVKGDVE